MSVESLLRFHATDCTKEDIVTNDSMGENKSCIQLRVDVCKVNFLRSITDFAYLSSLGIYFCWSGLMQVPVDPTSWGIFVCGPLQLM